MSGVLLVAFCAAAVAARPLAPRIGDPVPDFTATALDGTEVSLREAATTHRAVVVLFLSTVCPYANHFGRRLGELSRRYGTRGVSFIGVNSNQFETAVEIAESAQAHGQGFPFVRDVDATIATRLGASCSPEAYLVDGEGRLRYHGWVLSKQRSPDLERALDAVLDGRPVRLARTRAFGCAIVRPQKGDASR